MYHYAIVILTKVDHWDGKESDEKKFQQYLHVDNIPAKLSKKMEVNAILMKCLKTKNPRGIE